MPPRIHIRPLKTTAPAAMRGLQPASFVTIVQFTPSVDDQTSPLAPWPGSLPLYQPPMSHMRPSKLRLIGRSLDFHGASFVASVQVAPSG